VEEKKRLEKVLDNTMKQESKDSVNKKSIKYLCQRFEKEFRAVIQNMANEEADWAEDQLIPY
jgi:hypothetical protein